MRSESDVWVVDRPYVPFTMPTSDPLQTPANLPLHSDDFPDSMTTTWPEEKVAALLSQAFTPPPTRQKTRDTAPTAAIDVLVTFDAGGVSSHPNHISLYHGARTFLTDLMKGRSGYTCPVDLYVLNSVSVARKYLSVGDVPLTMATTVLRGGRGKKGREHPARLMFVNQLVGEGALGAAWGAMVRAHVSQMAWFRWLWIVFSRYMVMNDLRLEKVR